MVSLINKIITASLGLISASCSFAPDYPDEPVRRGSLSGAMSRAAENNTYHSFDAPRHVPQHDAPDKEEQSFTPNKSNRTVHELGSMAMEDGTTEKRVLPNKRSIPEPRPLSTTEVVHGLNVTPSRRPVQEQHTLVADGATERHVPLTKLSESRVSASGYAQAKDTIVEDNQWADKQEECPDAYSRFKEMEQEYGRTQMWQGCDGAYFVSKDDHGDHHDPDGYKANNGPNFGVKASIIPIRSGSIHQITESSLYLEGNEGNYAIGVAFQVADYEFDSGSLQEQILHDTISYGWSMYFKSYMNSSKVFISPYLLMGLGTGTMRWSYNQPLIEPDGYVIDSDSLGYG